MKDTDPHDQASRRRGRRKERDKELVEKKRWGRSGEKRREGYCRCRRRTGEDGKGNRWRERRVEAQEMDGADSLKKKERWKEWTKEDSMEAELEWDEGKGSAKGVLRREKKRRGWERKPPASPHTGMFL